MSTKTKKFGLFPINHMHLTVYFVYVKRWIWVRPREHTTCVNVIHHEDQGENDTCLHWRFLMRTLPNAFSHQTLGENYFILVHLFVLFVHVCLPGRHKTSFREDIMTHFNSHTPSRIALFPIENSAWCKRMHQKSFMN